MPYRIKCVIFDLDGVLVDSEPFHCRAWCGTAEHFRIEVSENFSSFCIGLTDRKIAEKLAAWSKLPVAIEDLLTWKNRLFLKNARKELKPSDGVKAGLDLLKLKGIPFAIGTSSRKDEAKLTLEAIGLEPYFDIIVSFDDVSRHKPDPETYLKASGLLGAAPSECAVIEDSCHGLEAAVKAGCIPLAVSPDIEVPLAIKTFKTTADAISWIAMP